MWDLWASLKLYSKIPVTFDGELTALSRTKLKNRLLVGRRCAFATPDGEVVGELMQGLVQVREKTAICLVRTDDGQAQIVTGPLSDAEIEAYLESPRTFFGQEGNDPKIESPLEFYDWIHASYGKNSKEHLLGLLEQMRAADLPGLRELPRERLLEIFAERQTEAMIARTGLGITPRPAA